MSNRPKIEVPDAEWRAAQGVVSSARVVFDAVELTERRKREDRLADAIHHFDDVCEHKPQGTFADAVPLRSQEKQSAVPAGPLTDGRR